MWLLKHAGLPALPHAMRWGAASASLSSSNQQLESASLGLVRGLEHVLHLSVATWPGIYMAVQSHVQGAVPCVPAHHLSSVAQNPVADHILVKNECHEAPCLAMLLTLWHAAQPC